MLLLAVSLPLLLLLLNSSQVEALTRQDCNGYFFDADNPAVKCFAFGPTCVASQIGDSAQSSFAYPSVALSSCSTPNGNTFSCAVDPTSLIYTRDEFQLLNIGQTGRTISLYSTNNLPPVNGQLYRRTLDRNRISAIRWRSFATSAGSNNSPGSMSQAWISHLDDPAPGAWRLYELQLVSVQTCSGANCASRTTLKNYQLMLHSLMRYTNGANQGDSANYPPGFCDPSLHESTSLTACQPRAVVPSTCAVDCRTIDANLQCSITGGKCECKAPFLPVYDQDNIKIINCVRAGFLQYDWSTKIDQLTGDAPLPRGNCFRDSSLSGYAWCRDYGGTNFVERCSR